jgi:predicted phage terminase large subunit-like protein
MEGRSRHRRRHQQRNGFDSVAQRGAAFKRVGRHSKADKETLMSQYLERFEAGRILLPTEASWLADFERELLEFPSGRYDDQVDALMLFLDWLSENQWTLTAPKWAAPIIVTRRRTYFGDMPSNF